MATFFAHGAAPWVPRPRCEISSAAAADAQSTQTPSRSSQPRARMMRRLSQPDSATMPASAAACSSGRS
jgi:hypothetical protein